MPGGCWVQNKGCSMTGLQLLGIPATGDRTACSQSPLQQTCSTGQDIDTHKHTQGVLIIQQTLCYINDLWLIFIVLLLNAHMTNRSMRWDTLQRLYYCHIWTTVRAWITAGYFGPNSSACIKFGVYIWTVLNIVPTHRSHSINGAEPVVHRSLFVQGVSVIEN